MADEIIKLLEYVTNNPLFQGAVLGYAAVTFLAIALVVCVFIVVMKRILGGKR